MRSIWALAQGIGPSKASSWVPGLKPREGAHYKGVGVIPYGDQHHQFWFHPGPPW